MKVTPFVTRNVAADGKVKSGGSVHIDGAVILSHEEGGCGLKGCMCSPGYWLTITAPRSKGGEVRGLKVIFDSKAEMLRFFKEKELVGKPASKEGE